MGNVAEVQCDQTHYYEDLERFTGYWQNDPKEMCYFVGRAVARVGHANFNDLFFAIGSAYFSFREICDRIDFICDHFKDKIKGEKGRQLRELVHIAGNHGVVCLKDKLFTRHDGIRVMLLRDMVDKHLTYSLRYYLEKGERARGYLKANWNSSTHGRPTFENVSNPITSESGQRYEDDFTFWNFRAPVELMDGVIVYPDAQGFYDLQETKSLGDFIVLVSNLLGFNN